MKTQKTRVSVIAKRLLAARGPLLQKLIAIRPQLARAAQSVYDSWEVDEEGLDPELGEGGICQDVAEAMLGVIQAAIPEMEGGTVSNSIGEQHVYVVVYSGKEAYEVDIPPHSYETGSGYSWEKIPDVVFSPEYISIQPLTVKEAVELLEYEG